KLALSLPTIWFRSEGTGSISTATAGAWRTRAAGYPALWSATISSGGRTQVTLSLAITGGARIRTITRPVRTPGGSPTMRGATPHWRQPAGIISEPLTAATRARAHGHPRRRCRARTSLHHREDFVSSVGPV